MHSDGTFYGRASPEIDVFEAQVVGTPLTGSLSQSAQFAPMNDKCGFYLSLPKFSWDAHFLDHVFRYIWQNSTSNPANLVIPNPSITTQNSYLGGVYQQAVSGVTMSDETAYELNGNNTQVYAYEYVPGFDNA